MSRSIHAHDPCFLHRLVRCQTQQRWGETCVSASEVHEHNTLIRHSTRLREGCCRRWLTLRGNERQTARQPALRAPMCAAAVDALYGARHNCRSRLRVSASAQLPTRLGADLHAWQPSSTPPPL
eukprot:6200198-Pleurochrysis_carterae.AAC.4